jgi:hypothetical protein
MRIRINYTRVLGWVRGVAISLAGTILLTLATLWLTAFSDEQKWFAHPHAQFVAAMNFVAAIVASAWFHWVGGAIIGFAIGIWLDDLLRRLAARPQPTIEQRKAPEKGFLDHQADLNKSVSAMNSIMESMSKRTISLGNTIGERTTELSLVNSKVKGVMTPEQLARTQSITTKTARILDNYCDKLRKGTDEFGGACDTLVVASNNIFNVDVVRLDKDSKSQVERLHEILSMAKNNVIGFRDAIRTSYGASAVLNEAINRSTSLLDKYINGLSSVQCFLEEVLEKIKTAESCDGASVIPSGS